MSKLIKKFQQPAGPIEFYSGTLPEVEIVAPIKRINDKTTGVYLVDTDLKRRNGRGRVYRGHRDGRDIYYLTSKNSGKIIGYTYDLPDENGKWSWDGYQNYLDNWTEPEAIKTEEGQYDRTHTERRKEIKRLNKRNPIYRGLTLNGNTDLSYAGTKKNNENQAALGQGLQTALNAAASAMFMGGPTAVDNIFDITDGLSNAAAGNWGMAGLSLGSALLPGISLGASKLRGRRLRGRSNPAVTAEEVIPEILTETPEPLGDVLVLPDGTEIRRMRRPEVTEDEAIAQALLRELDSDDGGFDWDDFEESLDIDDVDVEDFVWDEIELPRRVLTVDDLNGLQHNAQYRIREWLRPEYENHNIRNFTTHIPSGEVAETLRHFGIEPSQDYMNNLRMLDDYLVRARAGSADIPDVVLAVLAPTSLRILGRDYDVDNMPLSLAQELTRSSEDSYALNQLILNATDSEIANLTRAFGIPLIDTPALLRKTLRAYLNPENPQYLYIIYDALNAGIPELSLAFLRLGSRYTPLSPELSRALLDNPWDWNPANNALLQQAIQDGLILPEYHDVIDDFRWNMSYNLPTDRLHYNQYSVYDGTFPIEAYKGIRASTPELAKQYQFRAPDGVRGVFTEEDILNMSPERIELLANVVNDEPNLTINGISYNYTPSDITSNDIVKYLTETKNGVRTVKHPKTGENVTTTALAEEYVQNNMTAGHVITPHSLSVDSYPVKMQKVADAVRRGDVVKYPSTEYTQANGYGMRNRLNTSKELLRNADKLKKAQKAGILGVDETTNELGNRVLTYRNAQTGESFGSVEILSNQQTVDRINDYVNYFFRNYPENMRPEPARLNADGIIEIPKTYYVVKKLGGKLIPKQKRFNV